MRAWRVWLLCVVVGAVAPVWAGDAYPCAQAKAAKFLDGRFADWREPAIVLDAWCWRPEAAVSPVYGGALDCSTTLRLAWDEKRLYLALAVVDDRLKPAKEAPETGDAVLLRLVGDGKDAAASEFVLVWDSPVLLLRRAADGGWTRVDGALVGAARAALPPPAVPMPREESKPVPEEITKLWYEVALPWAALPGLTPVRDTVFGLEVQTLDRDAEALRGRLRWRGAQGAPHVAGLAAIKLAPPLPEPAKK
jgi:hypothetical protein